MSRIKVAKNISYDDIRKVYYVTFNYGRRSDNIKNKKTTKTYDDLNIAIKELKIVEGKKAEGKIVEPNKTSFKSYAEYWMNDIKSRNCAVTTLYGYTSMLENHIYPAIGDISIQDITASQLNRYFTKKLTKLGNNTVKKHYDIINSILKQATLEEKILKNPMLKIEPIKKMRFEPGFYDSEQLARLIDLASGNRMEFVINLAGLLGMRREEIAGLKWKNIDFKNRLISISEVRVTAGKSTVTKDTKSDSSYRLLSLPENIYALLINIRANQTEIMNRTNNKTGFEYVVSWEDGSPYRPNYISDLFKKFITDNDLPPIRLHDLRHTFASVAHSLGISIFEISKMLGHSDIRITSKICVYIFDESHQDNIFTISDSVIAEKNKGKKEE